MLFELWQVLRFKLLKELTRGVVVKKKLHGVGRENRGYIYHDRDDANRKKKRDVRMPLSAGSRRTCLLGHGRTR